MDFWDLTKLLVRRWLIVVPLLILSGGLAAFTATQVKPEYTATAFVQLVPPVAGERAAEQLSTPDQRNPWLGLGLETLGNAAIVTVSDRLVIEELVDGGYSDTYTLTMNDSGPLVTVEVVSPSQRQAEQTAGELVDRFTQSVQTLQSTYNVKSADEISARRLDQGTNIARSTSKIKRTLVAVAAVGIVLTVAVTVGIDALITRRRRRASALAAPAGNDGSATLEQPADTEPLTKQADGA